MKTPALALALLGIATPTLAEKPQWAGNGTSAANQRQALPQAGERPRDGAEEARALKEMKAKHAKKETQERSERDAEPSPRGLENQSERKQEQVMKELDKGSEQGQTARENRKKWWKFWE